MKLHHYQIKGVAIASLIPLDDEGWRHLSKLLSTGADQVDERLQGRVQIQTTRLAPWGSIVLKTYARGGLIRHINQHHYLRWGPVRAKREFDWLVKLHTLGLAVPKPMAYAVKGRIFYRTWLVSGMIANKGNLAELCHQDNRLATQLVPQIEAEIDRLCRLRILHVDLHPGNILVGCDNQIAIIDWDKARTSRSSYFGLLARYRRRWNRAIDKHGLPDAIRLVAKTRSARPWRSYRSRPLDDVRLLGAKSILIVLMGSIGDVIRGLAVATELKKHFPHSRLTWLVEPKCLEVVKWHHQIDEILVFERKLHLWGVWQLYRQLLRRHFDMVLDMQRHIKSGFFSLLANAPVRVGFHRRNAKEFNWLFNNQTIPPLPATGPKQDQYMAFCTHIGLPPPGKLDFGLDHIPVARTRPDNQQSLPARFIAMIVGSSRKSKDWPIRNYRRLITLLQPKFDIHIFLLGDTDQQTAAQQVCAHSNSSTVIDLVGRTSLYQLARLLKAAIVAVGPDSGPGHLAAAVGTPYIALFGPTAPQRVAPYGCDHLVVQADVPCAPCAERTCQAENNSDCMRSISAEMVEAKIAQVLQDYGYQHR
jgi:lipopolysaccharide heptosyltransferase I